LLYPTIGFHLFEPDEGRYAEIGREVYVHGNWIVPTLLGEPYLDKPPLMYWLIALSYSVGGISEASARMIPALAVHGTLLAVYWLGRRSVGERAAFWASVLLMVSPLYLGVARLLILDGLLTFFVTVSLLCGFEAVRTGRFRASWWYAAAIASGLGFLTKGPISELLLFPPLLAWSFLSGVSTPVRGRHIVAFGAVVLAVNMPWYVAIGLQQPEFLRYFFWEHNVLRFLRPFDHLQPVWYYLPILLVGFFPGVVLICMSAIPLMRPQITDRALPVNTGFWLLAGGWCLFFFSCSGSKLPTYILPALPSLCLGLGEVMTRASGRLALKIYGLIGASGLITVVLITIFVPWYAEHRSPLGRPELVMPYLADPTVPVVTYPRHIDSVAFTTGRENLRSVRTTELNQALVDCHFQTRTVFLFTHDHSYRGFSEALPTSLRITQHTDMRRTNGTWWERLAGKTPWGLCDIAVVEPAHGPQKR
jgi:4-amino-4-deoxy-L-arabinose transferase-like glycosyltransferase